MGRFINAAVVLCVFLGANIAVTTSGLEVAASGPCPVNTVVIVAHPDDGLAFMHDNIRWQRAIGNCVHFVSLTSYYDTGGVTAVREEGARDAYQKLLDANAPDDTPQHFGSAIRQRYGTYDYFTYFVHGTTGDPSLTLSFLRLPASKYPGKTAGSVYDVRTNASLITSLRTMIQYYRPDRVYTLNTAGLLDGINTCVVQQAGMLSANECDHYDHVGAAVLAKSALTNSGVPAALYEFHAYDMARGRSASMNITPSACSLFCATRDAYVARDTLAAATPWGALLSSGDMYTNTANNAGDNTPVFSNKKIRSNLATTACIGPAGGSSANGAAITVLGSCTNAPSFTLAKSGELSVNGKCVEAGASPTAQSRLGIFTCAQGPHQRWSYSSTTGRLTHVSTGLVLDVWYSGTAAGTPVQVFTVTGNTNQRWTLQ